MAKSFYLASRLRRYGYGNQYGARNPELREAILDLIKDADALKGSNIKGTLSTDVFQLGVELVDENESIGEYRRGEYFLKN